MLTRAFVIPLSTIGRAIAWLEARSSPAQASTIDVQSRVVAIECRSTSAADQIAIIVDNRPAWRRDNNMWLAFEVLEPTMDIEAELEFGRQIVSEFNLDDVCEVAECRVVEIGFPSEGERADFRTAALCDF